MRAIKRFENKKAIGAAATAPTAKVDNHFKTDHKRGGGR